MKQTRLNLTTYAKLLGRTHPRVIRSDAELHYFTRELLRLDEIENPCPEERALAELLTTLIEQYEAQHYAVGEPTPVETIKFLLEQRGLSAKDLWVIIGSKSHTSEIMNEKRSIGIPTAAKLGAFFHVSPTMFIQWKAERKVAGQRKTLSIPSARRGGSQPRAEFTTN